MFKLTAAVTVVHANIYRLDLLVNPLAQAFVLALVEHNVLHDLEVLGNRSLMSVNTALQLHDGTDGLALIVNHLERTGDAAHLHRVNHTGYFRGEVLHAELGRTAHVFRRIRHQTVVVTGILVVRKEGSSLIKRELLCAEVIGDRVQAFQCTVNRLQRDHRLSQDVTDSKTYSSPTASLR